MSRLKLTFIHDIVKCKIYNTLYKYIVHIDLLKAAVMKVFSRRDNFALVALKMQK